MGSEGHDGQPVKGTVRVDPPPWHWHVPSGHEHVMEQESERIIVMHPPSVGSVPPLPLPPHMTGELLLPSGPESGVEPSASAPLLLPEPPPLLLPEPLPLEPLDS